MDDSSKSDKNATDTHSVAENVYVLDVDNAKLAELGYRSEFKREFSLLETCAFSFSIMVRANQHRLYETSSTSIAQGIVASVSSTLIFGLVSGGCNCYTSTVS